MKREGTTNLDCVPQVPVAATMNKLTRLDDEHRAWLSWLLLQPESVRQIAAKVLSLPVRVMYAVRMITQLDGVWDNLCFIDAAGDRGSDQRLVFLLGSIENKLVSIRIVFNEADLAASEEASGPGRSVGSIIGISAPAKLRMVMDILAHAHYEVSQEQQGDVHNGKVSFTLGEGDGITVRFYWGTKVPECNVPEWAQPLKDASRPGRTATVAAHQNPPGAWQAPLPPGFEQMDGKPFTG